MNEKLLQSFREILGQFLSDTAKEKGLNLYNLEKLTGMPAHQITPILTGSKNYTVDSLAKVIHALNLYIFFANKEGKENKPLLKIKILTLSICVRLRLLIANLKRKTNI